MESVSVKGVLKLWRNGTRHILAALFDFAASRRIRLFLPGLKAEVSKARS
jgi:hypothetical protein